MKKLTDTELSKLRARCLRATERNYSIGEIRQYLKVLADETEVVDPPEGAPKGSAAHLQGLVQEAMDQRSGKKAKPRKLEPEKPKKGRGSRDPQGVRQKREARGQERRAKAESQALRRVEPGQTVQGSQKAQDLRTLKYVERRTHSSTLR